MDYVVGLAFNRDVDQLVMINKTKPDWQRGKLNGVGGKIEPNELPLDAMVREFHEETGLPVSAAYWRPFGVLEGHAGEKIYLFAGFSNTFLDVQTTTEEVITFVDPHRLPSNVVPNMRWIVPAALDFHHNPNGFSFLTAEYTR